MTPTALNDGDSNFRQGVNSLADPRELQPGSYSNSMNTVNRGGVVQCRPGYKWFFNLPDGNLQGSCFFTPKNAGVQMLFAVDGKVYVSDFPFLEYRQIPNLSFDPRAEFIYWCQCEQTATLNDDGSIRLIRARTILIMQDTLSAPAYWDAAKATQGTNANGIPVGGPMVWTGSRLWVGRGERVFASNIVDPTHFTEGKYFATDTKEEEVFIVPGRITAMAEIPSTENPQLLVFTDTTTTAFKSSIKTRADWKITQDFQFDIFKNIGCVAHRSIVVHHGLLWWLSSFGLTSFDAAFLSKQSSKFRFRDNEMSSSKAFLHSNLSASCAGTFENYLLLSVPYTDFYNRHTWVLDNGVVDLLNDELPPAWNGYWAGTRPVQWMTSSIENQSRIFHVSKDYDGKNRLWEAFQPERRDSGCDITWYLETRGYAAQIANLKLLKFAELWLSELSGKVDVRVFWSGVARGRYKSCLTKRILSNRGNIDAELDLEDTVYALKDQSRRIRTTQISNEKEDPLSSCCVEEADLKEALDSGFQFLILASGPGAVRGIRVFMELAPEVEVGRCEKNETNELNAVRFDGAAAESLEVLNEPLELFSAFKISTLSDGSLVVTNTGRNVNMISQAAADKVAEQIAISKNEEELLTNGARIIGGDLA